MVLSTRFRSLPPDPSTVWPLKWDLLILPFIQPAVSDHAVTHALSVRYTGNVSLMVNRNTNLVAAGLPFVHTPL